VIEVLDPGPLTLVEDLGRPGLRHLGVPASGAADPASLRLANRLVGNPEGAAALESTLAGPALRFAVAATFALTGAPAEATLDDQPVSSDAPVHAAAGRVLRVGRASAGLRTYVAVRGGLAVAATLGSRSADVLSGLGPPPLRRGDVLPVGEAGGPAPGVDVAPVTPPGGGATLTVLPGPRDDWFAPSALATLAATTWSASSRSDRSGVRLDGPALDRSRDGELPSEGLVPGALQVPPSGRPVVMLRDHPVTGGYPVLAVVVERDLPAVGQLRPGDPVRFRVASRQVPE
jgi:biotin-dependent carboxylase-like uncharacterized protein